MKRNVLKRGGRLESVIKSGSRKGGGYQPRAAEVTEKGLIPGTTPLFAFSVFSVPLVSHLPDSE
jgi:hypothetical protein